jgi:hypothetical protein
MRIWVTGEVSRLASLTRLAIQNNSDLRQLPAEIGQLKDLKVLSLDGCWNLEELPVAACTGLSNLRELDLNECRMVNVGEVPVPAGAFPRLEALRVRGAENLDIDALLHGPGRAATLTHLDLSSAFHAVLDGYPPALFELTQLRSLEANDIGRGALLPDAFSALGKLTSLRMVEPHSPRERDPGAQVFVNAGLTQLRKAEISTVGGGHHMGHVMELIGQITFDHIMHGAIADAGFPSDSDSEEDWY